MPNLRKRIEALEKALSRKQAHADRVLIYNPVTGVVTERTGGINRPYNGPGILLLSRPDVLPEDKPPQIADPAYERQRQAGYGRSTS